MKKLILVQLLVVYCDSNTAQNVSHATILYDYVKDGMSPEEQLRSCLDRNWKKLEQFRATGDEIYKKDVDYFPGDLHPQF